MENRWTGGEVVLEQGQWRHAKESGHPCAYLPPPAAAAQHAFKRNVARPLHHSTPPSRPRSFPHLAGHWRAWHLTPHQLLRDPGCTMWIARGTRVETSQGAAANGLADGLGCWAAANLCPMCAHRITKWSSSPGAPGDPAPVPPLSPLTHPQLRRVRSCSRRPLSLGRA